MVHYAMHSPSQRCISSRQMTDNIFEIETTALAHVTCAPQESGVLLTDFAAAYPSVNHSWIFSVLENTGCRFLRNINKNSNTHTRGICGSRTGTIPYGQRSTTRLSCEWFPFCNGLAPDLPMAPRSYYPKEPDNLDSLQPAQCAYADALANAHAYQATCLVQHFPGVLHHTFRLPKPKSTYPYLPNHRSMTSERGNDYHGWAICTDGGTRVVDGETLGDGV